MSFLDKIKKNDYVALAVSGGLTVYSWVTEHLWPVYSISAVVGAFFIIASAQEKQILADHLYGSPASERLRGKNGETVPAATKLLSEEAGIAVKQDVWRLSKSEFEAEYKARHGSDATAGGFLN